MSESIGFDLLHQGVQHWIWKQGWNNLRDIQEQAIEPILNANCDVIISASTAAGKTEAAFLPACSHIANLSTNGIGILYISPLKALINDQYRRLQGLCDNLGFPVTPWHGDVLRSLKDKQKKNPSGILLITPESLESLLLNQSGWCIQAFSEISYIIIDEFHAFIGNERGCQLQSLMHRLEFLLERTVPRIALSATLGDMEHIANYLRPNQKLPCKIITSTTSRSDLKIQLRGYVNSAIQDNEVPSAFDAITDDLYKILRGKSHLLFANSRSRTEELAAKLAELCEHNGVPNEFFPHHGSLSKELREGLESRLQAEKLPTTAVCTMTLELGIDIGSIDSIAQVTAPHSVASMRQRLGRSGRRGESAILRMFIPEDEITSKSHILDRLRIETFQSIAMINLLLKKWYEPSDATQYHFSTLVQQTLSVIGQYGGVRANQLWTLLCKNGVFHLIDQTLYGAFLKALGEKNLISQTHDGQIILGDKGEKLVEHYTFFSAFNTPEDYRLESEGRVLGTLPIDKPLSVGQLIIFAGRRWEILNIDPDKKLILLKKSIGGKPPKFGGNGQMVHNIVREEMFRVYQKNAIPIYLDKQAKTLAEEGIGYFHVMRLDTVKLFQNGNVLHLFPWRGDKITNTITMLLRNEGLLADSFGGVIDVTHCTEDSFRIAIDNVLQKPKPKAANLANNIADTILGKHDLFLPKEMRDLNYGEKFFDIDGAWEWLLSIADL